MSSPVYVASFTEIGEDAVARVGGKGQNLARMSQAGFPIPPGFCVTTEAFTEFMVSPELDERIAALDDLPDGDAQALRESGEALRALILGLPIPEAIAIAIVEAWTALGPEHAYAVRSSATAEDLPSASFAGQQDTYLNVIGEARLLDRVRACWSSLFTDRAISYRRQAGFDHRVVKLSVVVQRMVMPDSAGVMFTADPIDGRRHVISIDAGFGLGEALVSGIVNPDLYRVDKRGFAILERKTADKRVAIVPIPASEGGGTREVELGPEQRQAEVLSDAQIIELARLGVAVEDQLGSPQDIEWCFEGDELLLTQSRPITTLFPIPEPSRATSDNDPDPGLRIYFSFGHLQVMTDTIAPFGIATLQRMFPLDRDARGVSQVACAAGGRLFVDPTDMLRVRFFAGKLPKLLTVADARTAAGLAQVLARPEFRAADKRLSTAAVLRRVAWFASRIVPRLIWRIFFTNTETIVARTRAYLDRRYFAFETAYEAAPDPATRLRLTLGTLAGLFLSVFLPIMPSIAGGGLAGVLLRRLLGDRVSADDLEALRRGVRGNITTQMDLELGDVADVARAHPEVSAYLRETASPSLDALAELPGGPEVAAAFERFLADYGMRGAAEIDVTRPRWRDDPRILLQVLRGNLSRDEPGSHRAQHEAMTREGDAALERVVAAAPWLKRPLVRRLATAHRNLIAVREHPKFQLIRYFWLLHRAALAYADELVERGELDAPQDIWMLDIDEVLARLDGQELPLRERVAARRTAAAHHRRLAVPRLITSEGEILRPELTNAEAPEGAMIGTGASAGVVEGVARVVTDPTTAVLHAGEILVAPFTDPGWTPLFINAAGLVMEAGGMMTHGSVVAREYGIPAVVSVDGVTTQIRTGDRIRVDGTRGFVVVLEAGDH